MRSAKTALVDHRNLFGSKVEYFKLQCPKGYKLYCCLKIIEEIDDSITLVEWGKRAMVKNIFHPVNTKDIPERCANWGCLAGLNLAHLGLVKRHANAVVSKGRGGCMRVTYSLTRRGFEWLRNYEREDI